MILDGVDNGLLTQHFGPGNFVGKSSGIVHVGEGMAIEGKMVLAVGVTGNMFGVQDHGLHELGLGIDNVAQMSNGSTDTGITTANAIVKNEFFGSDGDRV